MQHEVVLMSHSLNESCHNNDNNNNTHLTATFPEWPR